MKLSLLGKGCSLRNRPDGPKFGFHSRPSLVNGIVNASTLQNGSSNHELNAKKRSSTVARAAPAPSSDVAKSLAFADSLPISEVLPEIISHMNGPGRGVVVEAPPGELGHGLHITSQCLKTISASRFPFPVLQSLFIL